MKKWNDEKADRERRKAEEMKAREEQASDERMGDGRASPARDASTTVQPDTTADETVSKATTDDVSTRGNQVGPPRRQTKFPAVVVKPLPKVRKVFTKTLQFILMIRQSVRVLL